MRPTSILPLFALCACVTGTQPAQQRDGRLLREMVQQERWAGEAVAGLPSPDELEAVRSGDRDAVADARKRWRRLLSAVERTTWIREAAPEALRAAQGDAQAEQEVISTFERAGREREEALAAAGELARALARSPARDALSLEELRRALLTMRSARESEQRLAAQLARGVAADGGSGAVQRLAPSSVTIPKPFIDAAAAYLAAHPGQEKALDGWPSQLAEERTQIRAALANREVTAAAPRRAATDGGSAEPADAGPGDSIAADGSDEAGSTADWSRELKVAGDAKKLLARRGPPVSILLRPDGLFALRYEEKRSCGVDQCDSTVDYLFNATGKLVRDEVISQKQ
jgi:hypothetical protein